MIHKSDLQIILTSLVAGGFLTAFAFSSNAVATANSIPFQSEETVAVSAPLTETESLIINMPFLEGGAPIFHLLEISASNGAPSEISDVSDGISTVSPVESADPFRTPYFGSASNKTDPNNAVSHFTSSSQTADSSTSHSPSSSDSSVESSGGSSSSASSKPNGTSSSSSKPSEIESESSGSPSSTGETLRLSVGGTATQIDAYSALCQVVEGEMGSSFSTEALKAQAIAAYSYIKYENKAGRAPSLPMRTPSQKVEDAVSSVMGQAVYYNGSIAFTPYHASSAGFTNSSAEVWGGSYSYLTNVSSAYDPSSGYKNLTCTIPVSTIKSGLEGLLGISLDGNTPQDWMSIASANQGGYVSKLTVVDESGQSHSITGRQLREKVLSYALKSHSFTFTCDGNNFVFTTNGYGHGVGMSQTGANGYAINEGWTYRQILVHYYPGTSVY